MVAGVDKVQRIVIPTKILKRRLLFLRVCFVGSFCGLAFIVTKLPRAVNGRIAEILPAALGSTEYWISISLKCTVQHIKRQQNVLFMDMSLLIGELPRYRAYIDA